MERAIAKLAIGGLLGVVAAFSISFGLMAVVGAFAVVVVFGIAWRSHAALCGSLCGFGLTWLVVGGSTFLRCESMGQDCAGSEGFVPYLIAAGVILIAGVAVGVLGIVRVRS